MLHQPWGVDLGIVQKLLVAGTPYKCHE